MNDALPEEGGGGLVRRVARQFVAAREADQFRNLRVGVQAGEPVLLARQRVEHGPVMEAPREPQVLFVPGARVQLREGFVHAAVLAGEHPLELLVGQVADRLVSPLGELDGDREGLLVRRVMMGVEQAGEDFVERVPRHPAAVQVEALRADVARGHLPENPLALGDGRDVAVAVGLLAQFQLGHDVVDAVAEARIIRRGEHHRAGRKVVAERVARHALRLPAAVDLALRLEARLLAEPAQEPVGLKHQEVLAVEFHRPLERPFEQPHVRQVESHGLAPYALRHVRTGGRRKQDDGREDENKTYCPDCIPHLNSTVCPERADAVELRAVRGDRSKRARRRRCPGGVAPTSP